MAKRRGEPPDEPDDQDDDADGDDEDESSLPDDAKRLLRHMGKTMRREMNSVLDERLRVQDDKDDDDDDGDDGEPDPPQPQSFMERIGW